MVHPGARLGWFVLGAVACRAGERVPAGTALPLDSPSPRADPDVVARVGAKPIRLSEVRERMGELDPELPAALRAREALSDLVSDALIAEAVRAHLPPAVEALHRSMAYRLLDQDIAPRLGKDKVPDDLLRSLYDRARRSFVHGRLVDMSALVIYTGVRMKAEARSKREAAAMDLGAFLEAHPPRGEEDLAAIGRDPEWARRGVQFRRMTASEDYPFSGDIGRRIMQLQRPGDRTPVLSDPDGFYVFRYAGERPPSNQPFDAVRTALLDTYYDRWRQQEFLRLADGLVASHDVKAYPELIRPLKEAP